MINNKQRIGDLTSIEFSLIERFVTDKELIPILQNSIVLRRLNAPASTDKYLYLDRDILKPLHSLTAKRIRMLRADNDPECVFKIGLLMSPIDSINWCHKLSKLTSTRHKNSLLKAAHGEIYSKERKYRFGLVDNPNCDRCGAIETIEHRIIECPSIQAVWDIILRKTNKIISITPINCDPIHRVFGAFKQCTRELLTIQAETLTRILYLKPQDNIPPPSIFVKSVLQYIIKKEHKDEKLCEMIRTLLTDT